MRIDDRLLGIAIALLGLGVIYEAWRLPSVPGTTFGPGLMPGIIGICLAGLGAKIASARFLTGSGHGQLLDLSVWRGQWRGIAGASWTILGTGLAILYLPEIGFPLLGLGYAIPLMLFMRARLLPAMAVSGIVVLLLHYIFTNLLYVPLSRGPVPLPW